MILLKSSPRTFPAMEREDEATTTTTTVKNPHPRET